MRHSTSTRRAAAAVAATALAGLITITPAHSEAGPGDDGVITPAEVRVWENEHSLTPGGGGGAPAPKSPTLTIDDNAVEYLQVGLGALAGIALAGGVAASAARHRNHAHPA
ncbi:hypothetical protein V6K52_13925 [Knoellia sp. S7-12]|uniref:hypothetical protein n=1 Tax=Knoellia sp. S7-12 TaxID=3126698 RepID=UPI0033677BA0